MVMLFPGDLLFALCFLFIGSQRLPLWKYAQNFPSNEFIILSFWRDVVFDIPFYCSRYSDMGTSPFLKMEWFFYRMLINWCTWFWRGIASAVNTYQWFSLCFYRCCYNLVMSFEQHISSVFRKLYYHLRSI